MNNECIACIDVFRQRSGRLLFEEDFLEVTVSGGVFTGCTLYSICIVR